MEGIHRQQGDLISLLLFFRKKEHKLKMGLREIGWGSMDWIQLAQVRDRWRALVNTIMNFGLHKMLGNS
jgi:hypothetical protein